MNNFWNGFEKRANAAKKIISDSLNRMKKELLRSGKNYSSLHKSIKSHSSDTLFNTRVMETIKSQIKGLNKTKAMTQKRLSKLKED